MVGLHGRVPLLPSRLVHCFSLLEPSPAFGAVTASRGALPRDAHEVLLLEGLRGGLAGSAVGPRGLPLEWGLLLLLVLVVVLRLRLRLHLRFLEFPKVLWLFLPPPPAPRRDARYACHVLCFTSAGWAHETECHGDSTSAWKGRVEEGISQLVKPRPEEQCQTLFLFATLRLTPSLLLISVDTARSYSTSNVL